MPATRAKRPRAPTPTPMITLGLSPPESPSSFAGELEEVGAQGAAPATASAGGGAAASGGWEAGGWGAAPGCAGSFPEGGAVGGPDGGIGGPPVPGVNV